MITQETILLGLVLLAGFYMAWSIGANDVANAMGTSVGSGALNIRNAVILAAILEFIGAFFFGSQVSSTIEKNLIDSSLFVQDPKVLAIGMLASLISAGFWLHIASFFGWPVSTTHSLIGAVVGFGLVIGGVHAIFWNSVFAIISSWVISPILGGLISYLLFRYLCKVIFYRKDPVTAAKKLTPFISFITVFTFSLLLFLEDSIVSLSNKQALFLSIGLGLIAAFIDFITTRNVIDASPIEPLDTENFIDLGTANSIEKAKKHLHRVHSFSSGEIKDHASHLLKEIDVLSTTAQKHVQAFHETNSFETVERIFIILQILTASLMAFSHGSNDVANAIGPLIAAVNILREGEIVVTSKIPYWALGLGSTGIIIGLATWGWRVIETIGKKLTELTPSRGFVAEFGAAFTILIATRLGLPVSTTHTLVGSVIGVGMARGLNAVNLNTTRDIIVSWLVTVPAGAALSVCIYNILRLFF